MINQDDLLKMWEKDVDTLRADDLTRSALEMPKLHSKYLTLYMNTKAEKIMRENRVKTLSQELDDYYSGKSTADVYKERPQPKTFKTKAALEKAIAADERMIKLHNQLEIVDIIIEGLKEIMKEINQMHFTVTNLVNIEKIRNGIV